MISFVIVIGAVDSGENSYSLTSAGVSLSTKAVDNSTRTRGCVGMGRT